MSLDLFIVLACSILGLLSHGARHQAWLGWILRVLVGISCAGEVLPVLFYDPLLGGHDWPVKVMGLTGFFTGLILFNSVRQLFSFVLTFINQVISGQVLIALIKKTGVLNSFLSERIYQPESMPHLIGSWIFITTVGFLLSSIDPSGIQLPSLPIPIPVPLEQLFSYNGLGLVMLAFCGVGIMITRKPMECLNRLGLVKPKLQQVGLGIMLIVMTFVYDYLWSLLTHQMPGELASKLSGYNGGTFNAGGGLGSSLVLALATALCAGIGEETLIRGALQPVFGILPAAILHGLLHGQFNHAPIFIIQVAGWSVLMGIARRYTNTTTTIIGHAGYNFVTTFMFAFNP